MPFVCACGQGLLFGVRYPMVGAHWWRGLILLREAERQLFVVRSSSSRCGALRAFSPLPWQVVLSYGPCSRDDFPEMLPGCRPLSYTEDTVSQETMSWASCSYPLPTLSSSVFLRLECSGCFVRVSIWAGHPMVGCFLCFLQLWVSAFFPMPYKETFIWWGVRGTPTLKTYFFLYPHE